MNSSSKACLVAALALALVSLSAVRANAEPPGLEYDEIWWASADSTSHPPGAFQGDLAAIKVALLNGELGSADSRKRIDEIYKEAADPSKRLEMMAISKIPGVGILAVLVALNAEKAALRAAMISPQEATLKAFHLEQQLGKWYHVTYLNGWTRREDVSNQTAIIVKPDQDRRI